MRALGGIGKGAARLTRGTVGGVAGATPILAGAAMGMGRAGGQAAAAGARGASSAAHSLRGLPDNLLRMHPAGPRGGVATAYRPPGSATAATGPGRKVINPSPRTAGTGGGGGEPLGLPPGPQTVRGRALALEPARTAVQPGPDGTRAFVGPGAMTAPRVFTPSTIGPRAAANARMQQSHGTSGGGPARPTTDPQAQPPQPGARSYRASPRSAPPTGSARADLASPPPRPTAPARAAAFIPVPADPYRPMPRPPRRLPVGELPRPATPRVSSRVPGGAPPAPTTPAPMPPTPDPNRSARPPRRPAAPPGRVDPATQAARPHRRPTQDGNR